ncbi:hypothetical protein GOV09_03500 [Candidatus Woesearchaeota archaeon]|nr:hypothetical protein [Candidatus Woesearchaeota archaeon]
MYKTAALLSNLEKVFVSVNSSFIEKLKFKINSKSGSIEEFNQQYIKIDSQTFNWPFKKNYGHNLIRLLKIASVLGVDKHKVYDEITGYYSWGSHNKPISLPKQIKLTELFVEGYGLYIAEGDTGDSGTKKARKLRFTNSNIDVIRFYIRWLRKFIPDLPYYINVILPIGYMGSYERFHDTRISYQQYNKIPKYRVCVDNAVVIDLFLALRDYVKTAALNDPQRAAAYLRGLMAGEGTVYNNKTRYVRLEMKNPDEINFVKKLLNFLNISYTHHKRTTRYRMESLYIGGKENLRTYANLIGFGAHKDRQAKLNDLVSSLSLSNAASRPCPSTPTPLSRQHWLLLN